MEVERCRALKNLSEDLGHSSMATTDTIYVQTEKHVRAENGKKQESELVTLGYLLLLLAT